MLSLKCKEGPRVHRDGSRACSCAKGTTFLSARPLENTNPGDTVLSSVLFSAALFSFQKGSDSRKRLKYVGCSLQCEAEACASNTEHKKAVSCKISLRSYENCQKRQMNALFSPQYLEWQELASIFCVNKNQ